MTGTGLWNMTVGVNCKYETTNGGWTYAPSVTVDYRFAFGDDSADETLRYDGGSGRFGTEIAEDSFFTRMGLLVKKENMGFGVHCGYERGSDTEATPWASIAVSIFSEINKKEARDISCASFLCEIFRPGRAGTAY